MGRVLWGAGVVVWRRWWEWEEVVGMEEVAVEEKVMVEEEVVEATREATLCRRLKSLTEQLEESEALRAAAHDWSHGARIAKWTAERSAYAAREAALHAKVEALEEQFGAGRLLF